MPIPDGTKIGVSTETPSLYFDSFLIAFVVSIKTCNDSDAIFPKTILTFLCISLPSGNKIFKFHCIVFYFYMKDKKSGSSSLLVVKSVIMNKIRKRYFIINNLIYSDILSI